MYNEGTFFDCPVVGCGILFALWIKESFRPRGGRDNASEEFWAYIFYVLFGANSLPEDTDLNFVQCDSAWGECTSHQGSSMLDHGAHSIHW